MNLVNSDNGNNILVDEKMRANERIAMDLIMLNLNEVIHWLDGKVVCRLI